MIYRIGTRDSKLALYQAEKTQTALAEQGIQSELILIKSEGDLNLTTPLHGFSQVGVFTKALDDAMLEGKIDIAVHSNKDLPTTLHPEFIQAAVLERDDPRDILVVKGNADFLNEADAAAVIATGSVRRKAQWKRKFPHHQVVPLRGNVQTRLQKLADNSWNGAIFGFAALDRLGILPETVFFPDWMIPAPAQGVISIVCQRKNTELAAILQTLNHAETAFLTGLERRFLQRMEGGCTAPIAAYAYRTGNITRLETEVLNEEGTRSIQTTLEAAIGSPEEKNLAEICYQQAYEKGAGEIIHEIKNKRPHA